MKTIFHSATKRGYFDHGWLKTTHSFSFGQYNDPNKTHFGALRVLNDDIVSPGHGFGTHPHENMEIVSIPLAGVLAHKDSTGTEQTIQENEVQVMSAGTGIKHSEYNHSKNDSVSFLQVWVFPDEKGHKPRYMQKKFAPEDRLNAFQVLVSPDKNDDTLWLNQDAYFSRSTLEAGNSLNYTVHSEKNGCYVFLIEGAIEIDGEKLSKRDALGLSQMAFFQVSATETADILVIEIPMSL